MVILTIMEVLLAESLLLLNLVVSWSDSSTAGQRQTGKARGAHMP